MFNLNVLIHIPVATIILLNSNSVARTSSLSIKMNSFCFKVSRFNKYKYMMTNSIWRGSFGCPIQQQVAATSALSERSFPASEVRGRSREDPMLEGRRPRGVTPRPRSGAVAERSGVTAERSHPHPRPGMAAGRSHPTSKERWLRGCRRA